MQAQFNGRIQGLTAYQHAILTNRARYNIIEAGTKTGKTTVCLFWLLQAATQAPANYPNCWWVAPVSQQADIAFRRMQALLPRALFNLRLSEKAIELHSGAKIWFKSAHNHDSLYGDDVWAVVLDEASRTTPAAWNAVRSTLTKTQGPAKIIGNVKGAGNWMHRLAIEAKAAERRIIEGADPALAHIPSGQPIRPADRVADRYDRLYRYYKITAYDAAKAGVLTYAEIEDAKRALPEAAFRELYLAEPAGEGANPFGHDALARATQQTLPHDQTPVSWGIDLGRRVDYTALVGLNKGGQVVATHKFKTATWQQTEDRIANIVGNGAATIDSTGLGDRIADTLYHRLPNLYRFQFTAKSKPQLYEALIVAISDGATSFPAGELADELNVFGYSYSSHGHVRYQAPQGFHDDLADAYALAWHTHLEGSGNYTIMRGR